MPASGQLLEYEGREPISPAIPGEGIREVKCAGRRANVVRLLPSGAQGRELRRLRAPQLNSSTWDEVGEGPEGRGHLSARAQAAQRSQWGPEHTEARRGRDPGSGREAALLPRGSRRSSARQGGVTAETPPRDPRGTPALKGGEGVSGSRRGPSKEPNGADHPLGPHSHAIPSHFNPMREQRGRSEPPADSSQISAYRESSSHCWLGLHRGIGRCRRRLSLQWGDPPI